jgi:hypothetical protein
VAMDAIPFMASAPNQNQHLPQRLILLEMGVAVRLIRVMSVHHLNAALNSKLLFTPKLTYLLINISGYCGSSSAYCERGCQSDFGSCD